MTLYKLTAADGSPVHGGTGRWSLPTKTGKPGRWRSVRGELVACCCGLHLLRPADIPHWLAEGVLWEVEADTDGMLTRADKVVVRRARLVRQVAVLDRPTLVGLACDFAEHVLPIFEKRHPKDERPRKAIETMRAWLRGEATIEQVRAASAAAAYAAAYAAASAAASAAYAAAYDAAYDAADAAAYAAASASAAAAHAAADAAAAPAERRWQAQRTCEVLGIPWVQP